jgi:hypothetical protein
MDLKGRVTIRGADPFRRRDFREMLSSEAWNVYQRRLDLLVDGALNACAAAQNADDWRKAQGGLDALRRVKLLAEQIEAELTEEET